jgi:hypothetical protein
MADEPEYKPATGAVLTEQAVPLDGDEKKDHPVHDNQLADKSENPPQTISGNAQRPAEAGVSSSHPETGGSQAPKKSGQLPAWTKGDRAVMWAAVVVIIVGGLFALRRIGEGHDRMARINLIFFAFIFVSFFVSLCKPVNQKRWGAFLLVPGLILWTFAVWCGSPGGSQSLRDVFRF